LAKFDFANLMGADSQSADFLCASIIMARYYYAGDSRDGSRYLRPCMVIG
jgi:hypothetical protein